LVRFGSILRHLHTAIAGSPGDQKDEIGRFFMRKTSALAAILLFGLPCLATTIISSDPGGDLAANPVSENGTFTINGTPLISASAGFTMGSTSFDLTSVLVELLAVGIGQFDSSVVVADLFGGTSSNPSGSSLVSLTPASGTISGDEYVLSLTPASAFTLDAATTYWLVLSAVSSVGGNLGWDSGASAASGSFATYVGGRQSVGSSPATGVNGANYIFEVNGTEVGADVGGDEVPEPRAVSAMLMGLFLLGGWMRRRSRATA
jgi:hypothetical protein